MQASNKHDLCQAPAKNKYLGANKMSRFLKTLIEAYEKRTNYFCIVVATMVLAIDYITGRYIEFPILYALPVALAAWRLQYKLSSVMSILLPAARVGFYVPWQEIQALPIALINAPITLVALFLYGYLVSLISRQTMVLQRKVKVLEGILPICASCKKIRNEKGEYEAIEKYVGEHSEASFSHSICSDCAKRLYPEFYKGKNEL